MFDIFRDVRQMNKRQLANQVLNFLLMVCTALMVWRSLNLITWCDSPIVVVLSGSMEPLVYRGDLLFLTNYDTPVRVGDIVVFNVADKEIPIVHRVIKIHEGKNGEVKLLTKGDNNRVHDRPLYASGQDWLTKKDLIGRVRAWFPYAGIFTILLNDFPKAKYLLLLIMGLTSLLKREE
ncbi:signal peptidase complex catalytic subunit SEC11C-like [Zophobas morio]|uniref:signal peptidase complex catalytic subunit SEC11C-like n=1 Tax=Zophobas morio TaxID=2755281 RepID=UPI0030837A28